MITTTIADQYGAIIKAATIHFNFATDNEHEAVRFIAEWPGAGGVLRDYKKIRDEIKDNRKNIGHLEDNWLHYCNEVELRLIKPSAELLAYCEVFLRHEGVAVSSDEIDSSFFGNEISPLERIAVDVETTLQRLIAIIMQELGRATALRDTIISNYERPQSTTFSSVGEGKVTTERQQILIHFYEGGKMPERKDKKYNKYIVWATPQKRLAYPNESESKLKHLIADIGIVLPNLTKNARQQAEKELNTLRHRLTVEK